MAKINPHINFNGNAGAADKINRINSIKSAARQVILNSGHIFNELLNPEYSALYLQRKFEKPYHIDYCFASAALSDKVQKVKNLYLKDRP